MKRTQKTNKDNTKNENDSKKEDDYDYDKMFIRHLHSLKMLFSAELSKSATVVAINTGGW